MTRLRIGFDAKRLFLNREGLGSYARTLVYNLQKAFPNHEYHLFTPKTGENYAEELLDLDKFNVHLPGRKQNKTLWRAKTMVQDLLDNRIDLFIGLSNELPYGLKASGIKSIVCIHDMIYKYFPHQFNLVDRFIIDLKYRYAINSADLILAMSRYTKDGLIQTFGIRDEEKLSVLYQSVHPVFEQYNIESTPKRSHFLFVGTINERKNLDYIVSAYEHLDEQYRVPVVVVGNGKTYKKKIIKKIEKAGLEALFIFKSNVSTEQLAGLYEGAYGLIFPSLCEGFGIPLLEALMLSVNVIHSQNTSITEVVGEHGIIIDLSDISSLNQAVKDILEGRIKRDKIKLQKHCERFNPQLLSEQLMSQIMMIVK